MSEAPKAINAYRDYLAIILDGKPHRFEWTPEQRRHVLADLAQIVAEDLRRKE